MSPRLALAGLLVALLVTPPASAALVTLPLGPLPVETKGAPAVPEPAVAVSGRWAPECLRDACSDDAIVSQEARAGVDPLEARIEVAAPGDLLSSADKLAGASLPAAAPSPSRAPAATAPRAILASALPPSLPREAPASASPEPRGPTLAPPTPRDPWDAAPRRATASAAAPAPSPTWDAPKAVAAVALVLAALAAYSRVHSRADALASPARARIHEIVQRDGVVPLPKLAQELGLGRTTVEHHLRVLERCAVVAISREGRAVLVARPGLRAAAPPPAVRRSPACKALLAILATRPEGIARRELHDAAAQAGVPLRTRNHALRALAQRGLVVEADGRFVAAGPRGAPGSQG